jgi:hypothetical protein
MIAKNSTSELQDFHSQIHNQLLAQRQGITSWGGLFETAWAALVIARHSPDNRQDEIINALKGEFLGERRLRAINKPYDLATCYMTSAFLTTIEVNDVASEFIKLAEEFLSKEVRIEWQERFHFYCTPEYVFAASLVYEQNSTAFSKDAKAKLQKAITNSFENNWYGRSHNFALSGAAYFNLGSIDSSNCQSLAEFVLSFKDANIVLEDTIPLLWFLELNWEKMRSHLSDSGIVDTIDKYLLNQRRKTLNISPTFITESLDFQKNSTRDSAERIQQVANARILSTIELLMLDEIAAKHAIASWIITQEEYSRKDVISETFQVYRNHVDSALYDVGLKDRLDAIYRSLESNNPADWAQAAMSSRQVLYDLSNILFQISATTYPYLKSPDNKPLEIAKNKEKNRFNAYLQQIGIRSKNPLVVKQLEYLFGMISKLIDETAAAGKRKPQADFEETRSIVLLTYLFLGELERLTKFQVVTELIPPGETES